MATNQTQFDGSFKTEFDAGETSFLLGCASITWLMIPGVGFFYNGLSPVKSSLVVILTCFWTVAIVSVQWYIIGYSLCLSTTGNLVIGNYDHILLKNIGASPSSANEKIPALLVGVWYCLFAAITPTIILGAIAERARFFPSIVFIFFWSTFVFDFITYWTWNANGWSFMMGALDFGGGGPVHISTGAAALAYAFMLGRRKYCYDKPPHNMAHVLIGTSFIWMGWLVANAGSGLRPNLRAVLVFITTNLAASIGGLTWAALDFIKEKKFSSFGFCTGVICGLVSITPASGYVSPSCSIIFGAAGSIFCFVSLKLKNFIPVDDAFDVFCIHGVGGMVGSILTGFFAEKDLVKSADGSIIDGGAVFDNNWKQIWIQGVDTTAGFAWSFFISMGLLFIINKIPGLGLRVSEKVEVTGIDLDQIGESMYRHLEELKGISSGDIFPVIKGEHFQPISHVSGEIRLNQTIITISENTKTN